ncbi:hypothetical protein D3C71_693710 [compost metagenome]
MKKITIVSRHYPPNKNINGILANQMAEYLIKDSGVEVTVFCMNADADGNTSSVEIFGKVVRLKQRFNPNRKIGKLLNMLYDGYILIKKSKKHPSDLVICTSSPPLLPFWASMMLAGKKKWAFWSLDLFPEGFVSADTIKETSWMFRFLKRKTYQNVPDLLIALGNEQAKHIQQNYPNPVPTIILPAGVTLEENKSETGEYGKPDWYAPTAITLGYFGNVGQAHNPEFIKQMILASSHHPFQFILSVYGIRAQEVKDFARSFDHVVVVENGIAQEHLQYIDIHLVTLRNKWTHAAVPSKAVTAISTGRPIVFCGSEESDNWQMFKEAAWFIPESDEMNSEIERFISGITRDEIQGKASLTKNIVYRLKQQVLDTYAQIGKYD